VKLRPYQQQLVDGALRLWQGGDRRIAMVMATGGGKTPTAMSVAEMSVASGRPVLWLAHRTELIDQAIDKAQQVAPGRRIGRLQGSTKQYRAEIVVGSVQTASTKTTLPLLASRSWGLIIIDETHHATADTYLRVLRELGAYAADGPLVLGVTATLDRSDGRALGEVFESIVEPRIGLIDLIRHPEGPYLVPPRGVRVRISDLDLGKVARTAGDYNSGALGAAMSAAMAPQRIVDAWVEHAKGCPTIAFLPTVALSIEQAQAFNDAGIVAVHLDGTTPADVRAKALDDYRAGRIVVLCNVGLFTEGTDLPSTSCVILGRPTSSGTLYQQMVGRGLRLHPGKKFCWILDVTGVTGRHKLATLASLGGAPGPEDMPDDLLMYEVDDDEVSAEIDETGPADSGPGDAEPPEYADGLLAHELVDLFGQSHSTWLRTPGGRWFVPAGSQGFVFLVPAMSGAVDRYDLRWLTFDRGHEGLIQADMEIGYAMAAGDEFVAARPMWQAQRDAPWRRERARGAGGRTKGEVFDDKMIAEAARRFDGRPL
jgi:superfamily II DNA or RNA helicase